MYHDDDFLAARAATVITPNATADHAYNCPAPLPRYLRLALAIVSTAFAAALVGGIAFGLGIKAL